MSALSQGLKDDFRHLYVCVNFHIRYGACVLRALSLVSKEDRLYTILVDGGLVFAHYYQDSDIVTLLDNVPNVGFQVAWDYHSMRFSIRDNLSVYRFCVGTYYSCLYVSLYQLRKPRVFRSYGDSLEDVLGGLTYFYRGYFSVARYLFYVLLSLQFLFLLGLFY